MIKLAYCDYIACVIRDSLKKLDFEGLIKRVGGVNFDIVENGMLISSKKTIFVTDKNDKTYRITIEEF